MSRQNIYDDPAFFDAYREMRAAESGINAAVEQPALMALLPDVKGRSVLDLGCGDGRLCRELADLGAARVVGVDPSTRMLAAAREFSGNPTVSYRQAFAEDAAFDDASFDLVVSSLALHYVADLGSLLARIGSWLRPGGWLVASMKHPMRTADPERSMEPGIVDHYATEGQREQPWFVAGVVKHHRRVSTILNAVIAAGLDVRAVEEPTPSAEALTARPDLDRHNRRPAILTLAAVKPDSQENAPLPSITRHSENAPVLTDLRRHAGLGSDAGWVDVVNAVAALPYGRAGGQTPADVLAAGRGTCSIKHYLLARALGEGWPGLAVTVLASGLPAHPRPSGIAVRLPGKCCRLRRRPNRCPHLPAGGPRNGAPGGRCDLSPRRSLGRRRLDAAALLGRPGRGWRTISGGNQTAAGAPALRPDGA